MAAAANTRMKMETECTLCLEVFTNPVVAGTCLHSFCRDCLRRHLEVNAVRWKFTCPLCRKECLLPQDGVDGLTANFYLANIIEIEETRSKLPSDGRRRNCNVCSESGDVASFCYCEVCDGILLCKSCMRSHGENSMTLDHVLFGLCESHFKPQKKYCRTCHCFLCSVCLFSEHCGHDVIESCEIFAENRANLTTTRKAKSSCKDEVVSFLTEAELLRDENTEKWVYVANFADDEYRSAKRHTSERLEEIDEEVAKLVKEKEELGTQDASLNKRYPSLMKEISHERTKSSQHLEVAISNGSKIKDSVEQTFRRAELHATGNVFTKDEFLELKQTEQELNEVSTQMSTFSLSKLREEMAKFPVLTLSATSFGLGCLKRRHVNLHFLAEHPHDVIYSVVHVANKIAALVRCPATDGAYGNAVYIWENPNEPPELLTSFIDRAMFMTSCEENLVIFRGKNPYIRIIDKNGQWLEDKAMMGIRSLKPWSGCVNNGHYFMVDSTSIPQKLVVLSNSKTTHDFKFTRMACSWRHGRCHRQLIYACDEQCIAQYLWSFEDELLLPQKIVHHGVPKFRVLDICCDDHRGLVFVVGVMERDYEIRVYLVRDADAGPGWKLERVDLYGEYLRLRSESSHPRISASGDQLVIAHDIGIAVFLLHDADTD